MDIKRQEEIYEVGSAFYTNREETGADSCKNHKGQDMDVVKRA